MPMNKNAVIRYKYLDELLSKKYQRYTVAEMSEIINEKLRKDGYEEVSLRCVQKDIKALEEEVFMVELERGIVDGKMCVWYANPGYSIFTKELSEDEKHLLSEVLSTLGQFDGLDNFEWLDGLKTKLGVEEERRIIQFSTNPDYLANSTLLGSLFTAIANKAVITLKYHTFTAPDVRKECILHPYLLKQYNNRWFLIGAAEDGYILTFALDRIDSFEVAGGKKYIDPSDDLTERFEDIVGVTVYKDAPIEKILLWVSDRQWPYIATKPLHNSQRQLKGTKAELLRKKFSMLQGGVFIEIRCLINYELAQLLMSLMDQIVVLAPDNLRMDLQERVSKLQTFYQNICVSDE